MAVQVKKVRTNRELKRFINFPYKLYHKHPFWIPPLRIDEFKILHRDKNAAFDHCEACYWLAYKEGRIAGRIGGVINRLYIEKWGKQNARLGWSSFVEGERGG